MIVRSPAIYKSILVGKLIGNGKLVFLHLCSFTMVITT